ncbi:terminase, partial [Acinetobacter baumannii]
AFLFLENVHYTEAYETVNVTDDTPEGREQAERKSRFSALREAAEKEKDFASLLRATAHPSLFDKTITGLLFNDGSKTLSDETYMLFTSMRKNTLFSCFMS